MEQYNSFIAQYPEYASLILDQMRQSQFPNLGDQVYADWTGAALPPVSLLESHFNFLREHLLGNPHSHHTPSALAMEEMNSARMEILRFFNADPDKYSVIFTPNATGAILLLQHYLFEGGELLLTSDNHNSVNGLREIAKRKGAVIRYAPINSDLTIDEESLRKLLSYPRSNGNKLFCYPAKSNYSGTLHSLNWIKEAQELGWDVLLDAAAYVSNNRLDLSVIQPHCVPISFYKIFGYPTGVGCLIIKNAFFEKLFKRWFSGGSILLVSVQKDFFAPEALGHARFEDGTVNFSVFSAIKTGLQFIQRLGDIKSRAVSLATWLYDQLSRMNEGDNSIIIHSQRGNDIVTFSIRKNDTIIPPQDFEQVASKEGIFVRTGCFCNPGVNEKIFGYDIGDFEKVYNDRVLPHQITIESLQQHSGGKPIGAIRVSFGYVNTFHDAQKFAQFTKNFLESL